MKKLFVLLLAVLLLVGCSSGSKDPGKTVPKLNGVYKSEDGEVLQFTGNVAVIDAIYEGTLAQDDENITVEIKLDDEVFTISYGYSLNDDVLTLTDSEGYTCDYTRVPRVTKAIEALDAFDPINSPEDNTCSLEIIGIDSWVARENDEYAYFTVVGSDDLLYIAYLPDSLYDEMIPQQKYWEDENSEKVVVLVAGTVYECDEELIEIFNDTYGLEGEEFYDYFGYTFLDCSWGWID